MKTKKIQAMRKRHKAIQPADELRSEALRLFSYDEKTGLLIWRELANPGHPGKAVIGEPLKGSDGHGYGTCRIFGHRFKTHHIVWLIKTGELPRFPVDHINGDRRDNRFENLRLVTDKGNSWNSTRIAKPTAGIRRSRNGRKFIATIEVHKHKRYLGTFSTIEEARAAYVAASRALRGELSAA